MREIKFRAWGKEYEEMISDPHCDPDNYNGDINFEFKNSEDVIWMQYTGLKDRFGDEIYEGDVVIGINRISESEIEEKVTFLNGCFMFGNWNAHEYFNKHTEIFIAGNIYELGKNNVS